ncbi:MAG: hypothetical protein R2854_30015 [Caldilineaceae bacterium]
MDNSINPFGLFLSGVMERTIIYDRALSAAELNAYALSCQLATADGTALFRSDDLALTESTTPLGDISRTTTGEITVDSDLPVPTISAAYFSRDGAGYVRSKGTLIVAGEVTDPTSYATCAWSGCRRRHDPSRGHRARTFAWNTLVRRWRTDAHHPGNRCGRQCQHPGKLAHHLGQHAPAISIDSLGAGAALPRPDRALARTLLGTVTDPVAGVHPGSGVEQVDVPSRAQTWTVGWQPATLAPGLWSLDYALPEVIGARASEPTGAYTVTVRATDRVSNTTAAPDYVTVRAA